MKHRSLLALLQRQQDDLAIGNSSAAARTGKIQRMKVASIQNATITSGSLGTASKMKGHMHALDSGGHIRH